MISIVLPTYNGEKYIRESIDSILSQTYQDWELVVIDDCSDDNTNMIVSEYCKKDKRIKLFKNEKNLRLPASLNRGFSLTQGEYLTWTSDDNKYKPNALKVMADTLASNPNLGLVFSAIDYIDAAGNKRGESKPVNDLNTIYYRNIISASFMYTRKVYNEIGEYDVTKFLVEDYDYWLRVVEKFDFKYIEKSLYQYRTHSGSLTETKNRQMLDAKIKLYEEKLKIVNFTPSVKRNIYKELAIANFSLDRYGMMKMYIGYMKKIQKDIHDLPAKVRVANIIGKYPTLVLKKINNLAKRGA